MKRAQSQIVWIGLGDAVAALIFVIFVIQRRQLLAWVARRADLRASDGAARVRRRLHRFAALSLLFTLVLFLAAYLQPHRLAAFFDRAVLIPLLFGALVLGLSELARIGHRSGWPVLVPLVALAVLVTATNTHLNDVRLLPRKPADQLTGRQIELKTAVDKWRAANGCQDDVGKCPYALVIAAEGGASRAAFMAATFAGEIIDRTKGDGAPGRKIFAISGVSGGAFGAATIRAALADSAERQETLGRRPALRDQRPNLVRRGGRRDRPERLLALVPAIAGVGRLSVERFHWPRVSRQFRAEPKTVRLGFADPRPRRAAGAELGAPLQLYFRAQPVAATLRDASRQGFVPRLRLRGRRSGWLPLLLLNGASVSTGRRIIASDLISTFASPDGNERTHRAFFRRPMTCSS